MAWHAPGRGRRTLGGGGAAGASGKIASRIPFRIARGETRLRCRVEIDEIACAVDETPEENPAPTITRGNSGRPTVTPQPSAAPRRSSRADEGRIVERS